MGWVGREGKGVREVDKGAAPTRKPRDVREWWGGTVKRGGVPTPHVLGTWGGKGLLPPALGGP